MWVLSAFKIRYERGEKYSDIGNFIFRLSMENGKIIPKYRKKNVKKPLTKNVCFSF